WSGPTTAVPPSMALAIGMIDRSRPLPTPRSAVLAGRTVAPLARHFCVVFLVLAVGAMTGFRFHGSALAVAAGIVVVLAFAFALSWVFAFIALYVKDAM